MSAPRLSIALLGGLLALHAGAAAAQPGGSSPAAPTQPEGDDAAQREQQPRGDEDHEPSARTGEQAESAPPELAMRDVVRTHLEPSYLVYPIGLSGLPPLYFEANIAPHFVVDREGWPVSLVLTPKILLRMFREPSQPVKTPSYMPRLTFFLWFTDRLTGAPQLYTSLAISHHSNGQSGGFLDDDGAINHETGDFSTNYLELSLYVTGHTQRLFGWSSLSLEWHPDLNRTSELAGRYGLLRLHLASAVLSELPLRGVLSVRLSAILDDLQRSSQNDVIRALERFPFSVRYAFAVPGFDLGFYVAHYFGQDYYNIWFDRLINVLQIGIFGGVTPELLQTE